ncbi:Aspartic proteinase CDR1 [Linum perenne]
MTPTTTTLSLHLALIILLSSSQSNAFPTRLIHRDSNRSPVEPISVRAARTLQSSLTRHTYISSLNDVNPQDGADIELVEGINDNIFYVNFTIGSPPVQQLAVMDTTSNTLWVKCLPCSPCSRAPGITFFDPAKSKSFAPLPCGANGCSGCTGILATEQLAFAQASYGDAAVVVPNLQFGCSSLVTESKEQEQFYMNGVLPLGFNGGDSFVGRLGGVFSYCIGSVTLNITNDIIANMSHKYGVVIDSGAELSYLYTEAFDVVKAAISDMASTMLVQAPTKSVYELCYRGSVYRAVRNFPKMGIQFEEGAELVLDNFGMFIQVDDDVFCFAFARSPTSSFIGMMAQQGYNVGYDLVGKRLHFQELDCEVLG